MNLRKTWPWMAGAVLILTLLSFAYFPRSVGKGAREILKLAVKAQSTEEKISLYEKAARMPGASKAERFGAAAALAGIFVEQGENEKAEPWFEMALKNGVKGEVTYQNTVVQYADALLRMDKADRAAVQLKGIVDEIEDPGQKNVALDRYASALVRTEKFTEAVRQYETLLKLTPENESFILNINYADTVSRCKEHERALEILNRLTPAAPGQRSTIEWTRAEILVRMNRQEEAINSYFLVAKDAETPPGQQADALLKIASLYLFRKENSKADDALLQAFEKNGDPNQIALRVIELAKISNPAEQDGVYDRWIERLAQRPNGRVLLLTEQGKLAMESGNQAKAKALFQQALKSAEGETERKWLEQIIQDIESEEAAAQVVP